MKASELKAKSVDELKQELEELLKEAFNLRIQKASGQFAQVHRIKQNRRDVARVKTVLNEKAGS